MKISTILLISKDDKMKTKMSFQEKLLLMTMMMVMMIMLMRIMTYISKAAWPSG